MSTDLSVSVGEIARNSLTTNRLLRMTTAFAMSVTFLLAGTGIAEAQSTIDVSGTWTDGYWQWTQCPAAYSCNTGVRYDNVQVQLTQIGNTVTGSVFTGIGNTMSGTISGGSLTFRVDYTGRTDVYDTCSASVSNTQLTLTSPAQQGGAAITVVADPHWVVPALSNLSVATVISPVVVSAGQSRARFQIKTAAVLMPFVVNIRATYGGSRTVELTVMPDRIPPIGDLANDRVAGILNLLFTGLDVTTLAGFDIAYSDANTLRNDNRNPTATKDIYLAAAEHFLLAATMVARGPTVVRIALEAVYGLGLPLWEAWKGIYYAAPADVQLWIDQNLPLLNPNVTGRGVSAPTALSLYWMLMGLKAGCSLK